MKKYITFKTINNNLISIPRDEVAYYVKKGSSDKVTIILKNERDIIVEDSYEEVDYKINPPGIFDNFLFRVRKIWDFYRP